MSRTHRCDTDCAAPRCGFRSMSDRAAVRSARQTQAYWRAYGQAERAGQSREARILAAIVARRNAR